MCTRCSIAWVALHIAHSLTLASAWNAKAHSRTQTGEEAAPATPAQVAFLSQRVVVSRAEHGSNKTFGASNGFFDHASNVMSGAFFGPSHESTPAKNDEYPVARDADRSNEDVEEQAIDMSEVDARFVALEQEAKLQEIDIEQAREDDDMFEDAKRAALKVNNIEWSDPVKEGGHCIHFVILTTQRSGSTWLLQQLPTVLNGTVRNTWEAFNAHNGQAGDELLRRAELVTSATDSRTVMTKIGAKAWAEHIFYHLETATASWLSELTIPCAVGFKIMGPDVDAFSIPETEALLQDRNVKKIILEREDTKGQWLSKQWACWSDDFGSHSSNQHVNVNKHAQKEQRSSLSVNERAMFKKMEAAGTWKEWVQARADEGVLCKVGGSTYTNFAKKKAYTYGKWREILASTRQDWLELKTEKLEDVAAFDDVAELFFS